MQTKETKHSRIVAEIVALKNLDRAMRYLEKEEFLPREMDVVAQDEFSHDVVIPFTKRPYVLVLSVT